MGAAGRDFHNFNTYFRENLGYEVVAFTAAQISELDTEAGVEKRVYPPELSGRLYPDGIMIYPETRLTRLIQEHGVDEAFFSYSDVSATYLHDKAAEVQAAGASFVLLGPRDTMIKPSKPLISVCASRTGSGKSPTSRWLVSLLRDKGFRVVVIRHPMPYGDLVKQRVQRFETYEDLDRHRCTIEEREEYEPHIDNGFVVYAGVDYERIVREAEKEADVILWDGGNNDTPFYRPDLHITLVDPHRAGHELSYYPGETNLRISHLLIVNKVDTADPVKVEQVLDTCREVNPAAKTIKCRSVITADDPALIRGKRALVVEDGPTLTHGGMEYGAGWFAAKQAGAAEIVDARPYAVGTIKETYEKYPNAARILPAMGYGDQQVKDLEDTINAADADIVVEGTPIDLKRIISVNKPIANIGYELEEIEPGVIEEMVAQVVGKG